VGTIRVVAVRVGVAFVRAERALVEVHAFAVLLLVSAKTGALVGAYSIDAVGIFRAEERVDGALVNVGAGLAVSSVASFA